MALESRLRPRNLWFTLMYGVLCLVLGVWGAYDYWERIPRQESEFEEYQSATERMKRYTDLSVPGAPPLSAEQQADYQRAREVVDRYASGAPTRVAVYDRPLQLWVYVVGCGILGTGWCALVLVRDVPRRFRMDDEGMLHAGARRIASDDVIGIDMSRWMAKSIATLEVRGGPPLVLDDYKFGGMHLIVGTYAHRFDPLRWNADATLVKRSKDPGSEEPQDAGTAQGTTVAPDASIMRDTGRSAPEGAVAGKSAAPEAVQDRFHSA